MQKAEKTFKQQVLFSDIPSEQERNTEKIENKESNKETFPTGYLEQEVKEKIVEQEVNSVKTAHSKEEYHSSQKKKMFISSSIESQKEDTLQNYKETVKNDKVEFSKETATSTQGVETEFQNPSYYKKIEHLEGKATKARNRVKKAKAKPPKKKEYRLERKWEEAEGKATYFLVVNSVEKPYRQSNFLETSLQQVERAERQFLHNKIAEYEKENVGVESTHKTEQMIERGVGNAISYAKRRKKKHHKKIEKLEQKQFQTETKLQYEKFLEEHPELKKKQLQKRIQKHRIKKEYQKAWKQGQQIESFAIQVANIKKAIRQRVQKIISNYLPLFLFLGVVAFLLLFLMTAFASCSAMVGSFVSTTMEASYLSVPNELEQVELGFTKKELDLQLELDAIEITYPNYDEYRYELDAIGHSPMTLISFLSTMYSEFTYQEVSAILTELFYEMYVLELTPTTEVRTRIEVQTTTEIRTETEIHTGTRPITYPDGTTGTEEYEYEVEVEYEVEIEEEVEVDYEVRVLKVALHTTPLESIAISKMDEEQMQQYLLYQETKGLLQEFASPLELDWEDRIFSPYGYRKHPNTEEAQLHRGLDIAVAEGTKVYASCTGKVITIGYDESYGDYIVIEDNRGFIIKYAPLENIQVNVGQEVVVGDWIGTIGRMEHQTEPYLHLELIYGGEYYNPIFYFSTMQ